MSTTKAYKVTNWDAEISVIVFAVSVNAAKSSGFQSVWFCDGQYIDLRCTRLPALDNLAAEKGATLLEGDESWEIKAMREIGWYEYEGNTDECRVCRLHQWEDLPESELIYPDEDFNDGDPICRGCAVHILRGKEKEAQL
jgi:hypothetical protein